MKFPILYCMFEKKKKFEYLFPAAVFIPFHKVFELYDDGVKPTYQTHYCVFVVVEEFYGEGKLRQVLKILWDKQMADNGDIRPALLRIGLCVVYTSYIVK